MNAYITAFNIAQINRSILNQPPLKCECGGCEPGMYFECCSCRMFQPWCMGQDKSRPDLCDDCRKEFLAAEQALKNALRGISS